jgi:hypothetical protein
VPTIFAFGGYQIYRKNAHEAEERVKRVTRAEKRYIDKNPDNMIKL